MFETALIEVGLKAGDIAIVHSDISAFIDANTNKDNFLGDLLQSFLNVLKDGTLVVPTYTYSFCKNEPFDVNTKSKMGAFAEFVRKRGVRSSDPIFSHAAIGGEAKELMDVGDACFGDNSFFDKLYKADGKIINFGMPFEPTFIHYIEKKFGVSYRYDKKFSGIANGKPKEVTYFVSPDLDNKNPILPVLYKKLTGLNLIKKVGIGNGYILCSRARDCYEVGFKLLGKKLV